MGKNKYNWPSDKEVIKGVEAFGISGYAKKIGVPRTTLSSYLERLDIDVTKVKKNIKPTNLDEEVSETEILKERVKELEAAHRKERKSAVMDERITQAVVDATERVKPQYKPAPYRKSKKEEHEFVLLWSDTHAGEIVSAEETNNINTYDWDIMLKRMDNIKESILSYQENRPYKIKKLNILGLGDMLSGNIHAELEATNEMPLAEATVQFGVDNAHFVDSLHEYFPEIHFAGIVGNHPRAHKKPWFKQGYDNADWTAYNISRLILKHRKNITFDIPKASQNLTMVANRFRILSFHGDNVRSTMPGVPWGGIMRRVNALQAAYTSQRKSVDMFVCGHFHSAALVQSDAGQIAVNGSVKGVDEFSLKSFGGGRPPQQLLLTFHPRYGLTDVSMLDLDRP